MRTRWLVALLASMVGAVWIAQGAGLLGGSSPMVGDPRWAVAGVALLVIGLAAGISAWRSRDRTPP